MLIIFAFKRGSVDDLLVVLSEHFPAIYLNGKLASCRGHAHLLCLELPVHKCQICKLSMLKKNTFIVNYQVCKYQNVSKYTKIYVQLTSEVSSIIEFNAFMLTVE